MARMILRILGRKGRTTIPFSLRKELGLQPGDIVSYTLENDGVKVRREELCDYEHCPVLAEIGDEVTPDSVLDDFNVLSSHDQYRVMSTLIAQWAGKFAK